jgi:hypothetical protein
MRHLSPVGPARHKNFGACQEILVADSINERSEESNVVRTARSAIVGTTVRPAYSRHWLVRRRTFRIYHHESLAVGDSSKDRKGVLAELCDIHAFAPASMKHQQNSDRAFESIRYVHPKSPNGTTELHGLVGQSEWVGCPLVNGSVLLCARVVRAPVSIKHRGVHGSIR